MSHTLGPWHVAGAHGYGDLAGHAIRSGNGLVIAVTVTDVPPLEQDSHVNARLIAAAPELLSALESAEIALAEHCPGLTYLLDEVISPAIAKATGATPATP